LTSIGTGLSVF